MIVDIVTNATRMPTDGFGASAAERENGNLTAATQFSASCSAGAAGAVAGDLILTGNGANSAFWAEVTGPAVAGVLPVKNWKKWGQRPVYTNTGQVDPVPAIVGAPTYRIFPASCLQYSDRGWRIKRANLIGVAASTLTINGPTGSVDLTIPSTVASPMSHEFNEHVKGPFTVVCSNHAIVGSIEFEPEGP
jgi:hypothetical protein